jgi:hypothetical protein
MYKLEVTFHTNHMNHDGYCSGAEVECTNDQYDTDDLIQVCIMDIPKDLADDCINDNGDVKISALSSLNSSWKECTGSGYCYGGSTRYVVSARIICPDANIGKAYILSRNKQIN